MLTPGVTYWPFSVTTVVLLVPFSPSASLLCDVHSLALFSLLGEMLVMATLLIHAPMPVHSLHHPLLFFASEISVAGKVPHGPVELGILIFQGIALPTSSNDQNILISTVDSALDNCNVC